MILLPTLLLIGTLLAASAFFSCSETAIVALNKIRLRHLVARGTPSAKTTQYLVAHLDQFIATLLICNNVVNVAISVFSTVICVAFWGPQAGTVIATAVVTCVLLVFGEITPKIFATLHADRIALLTAPALAVLVRVLQPVTRSFTALSHGLIRALGGQPTKRNPLLTEEELRIMIEVGKEEGLLNDEERRMLHRIFEFGDTMVRDVMIPREQMVALELSSSSQDVLRLLVEEGHSRIPVYEGDVDHIRGILYSRDLLYIWHNEQLITVSDLLHPAYFIADTQRVSDVLRDFQRLRVQIAVVQQHGTQQTVGLVTIEDLLEEIVGDIGETG